MIAQVPPPAKPTPFAVWLDAVDTHVPGARDEPVRRVASWSRDELTALLPHVSRQPAADRLRIVERALVLHTDIAIAHRVPQGGYLDLAAGSNTSTLVQDGRSVGQTAGTFHWEFARRLIDRLPRGDDRLRVGRRFYRAAGALLQTWTEYPELTFHLAAARRVLGEDAVLLMYEGTRDQAYAGPRIQRFFDEQRGASRNRASMSTAVAPVRSMAPAPPPPPSVSSLQTRAERLFRRALELDSTLVEARIRLAHVLGDRGRHADAAAELARATTQPLPHVLDYYAALLTGRGQRALGNIDAAGTAFERAASLFPRAPAPRYGLSEIAMTRGDRPAALSHLLEANGFARLDGNEPWWWILRAHEPAATDLIDDMRRAVQR